MKYLFLDIDGVLVTESNICHAFDLFHILEKHFPEKQIDLRELTRDEYGERFDSLALRALKWIVDQTGAKIVMSSTMRNDGMERLRSMWKYRECPGELIGITPDHSRITGSTLQRGKEIQEYLAKAVDVESYAILDDDNDMEPLQFRNFVQTDPQYGLTFKDAEKIIAILNRNEKK